MKEIIYNYDNLTCNEINDISVRIKVLLINSKNIILGYERGIYQFPGGHLEKNESHIDCIKREIMEETGIEIMDYQIDKPIYKITYLNKDYPNVGNNRKSEIYYYVINILKQVYLTKTNYTEHELSGNFSVEEISLDTVVEKLKDNICNNEKNKIITPDMITVIEEYMKSIE